MATTIIIIHSLTETVVGVHDRLLQPPPFAIAFLKGFVKLKKVHKSKINLDRAHPTHPPTPHPNFVLQFHH